VAWEGNQPYLRGRATKVSTKSKGAALLILVGRHDGGGDDDKEEEEEGGAMAIGAKRVRLKSVSRFSGLALGRVRERGAWGGRVRALNRGNFSPR